jgi:prepilin-type processing-associated H-X9-DG protein
MGQIATLVDVQSLEGRRVNVALADGSVMGPVPLVLARRNTLWVVADGEDTFVPLDRVVNVWDAPPSAGSPGAASRAAYRMLSSSSTGSSIACS